MILLFAATLCAYFIGAMPTAVIVAKRVGDINIFESGSGNPGASNVFRVLGPRWASATLGIDVFKGYLPVWLVSKFADKLIHPIFAQTEIGVMAWIGFAAFLGHVFSPFLHFKGGKGAATSLGAMFALAPYAATFSILVYALALFIWKKFSVATLCTGLAFPILLFLFEGRMQWDSLAWGTLVPVLLMFTHRSNIKRILRGGELPLQSEDEDTQEGAE